VKKKILFELRKLSGSYVSGEALSVQLGVSRTAIWKHVRELREEGYKIGSSSKKGYMLSAVPELNENEIKNGLQTIYLGRTIVYLETVGSTNTYAKKISLEGCHEGTVVVSENQTSARGRLGREWHSEGGKGIWMSVVLRPSIPPESVQIITLAAAVAVVKAIQYVTGIEAAIKWPNDIILNGKKLCGILTEMSCEMERVNFIVVGIGINVNHSEEDFPQNLRKIATSLKIFSQSIKNGDSHSYNRSAILKRLLFELEQMYNVINNCPSNKIDVDLNTNGNAVIAENSDSLTKEDSNSIVNEWRKYSLTLGKEITVIARGGEYNGIAVDITSDGRLIVLANDGIKHEILSGEVSIRGF